MTLGCCDIRAMVTVWPLRHQGSGDIRSVVTLGPG